MIGGLFSHACLPSLFLISWRNAPLSAVSLPFPAFALSHTHPSRVRAAPGACLMPVQATHDFFRGEGFLYLQSPIITASDCEGAGEMFRVTTLPSEVRSPRVIYAAAETKRVPWLSPCLDPSGAENTRSGESGFFPSYPSSVGHARPFRVDSRI